MKPSATSTELIKVWTSAIFLQQVHVFKPDNCRFQRGNNSVEFEEIRFLKNVTSVKVRHVV